MAYSSWYECVRGCGQRYALDEVVYRCQECGGLLDVQHDLEALREKSQLQWKETFEDRAGNHAGSGVWRYKEWVSPQLDPNNVVSLNEGNTNLFRAPISLRGLIACSKI